MKKKFKDIEPLEIFYDSRGELYLRIADVKAEYGLELFTHNAVGLTGEDKGLLSSFSGGNIEYRIWPDALAE